MRILVAEDEAELSRALKAVLDHQGYETDVVGDGLSAVEKAGESSYDCTVFDIMMPVMDGLDAVREIRSMVISGISRTAPQLTAVTRAGRDRSPPAPRERKYAFKKTLLPSSKR